MIVRTARWVFVMTGGLLAGCSRASSAPASATAAPEPVSAATIPATLPLKYAPRPTSPAITAADLMTRLYTFADDSMEGREFGERGNVRATSYIERELRRLGLEPAGENGTYFQVLPTHRRSFDPATTFGPRGAALTPWTDFAGFDLGPGVRSLEGVQVIYGGVWGDSARMAPPAAGAGKLVLLTTASAQWNLPRARILERFPDAAGFALATLDRVPAGVVDFLRQPALRVGNPDSTPVPAHIWVSSSAAERLLGVAVTAARPGATGVTLAGGVRYRTETPEFPARNVVAVLRGSDPVLRSQYVAIGAHNDHIGTASESVDHDSLRAYNTVMRPLGADDPEGQPSAEQQARISAILDSLRRLRPARRDSIGNGADDDGSGSVAILEMAEALVEAPVKPKRSILFVWHTGEEAGLLGAQYFTDHPTVPRDSIVTALNIDMIGRGTAGDVPGGGPTYLQLIGSRRLSRELGDLVETVNTEGGHGFRFDYQFDANGHPGQYYCRSDHYEYARYGIPVTFFSTGSHRDYHMVTDEPQYIDYAHLARVTTLIHDIAVRVANLDRGPALSAPKPDPEGQCVQ
ncbi:MAG TPA: M20/M25/M40 family metallo-hydrolase [Gemmatimonadales bacterium]|nr:M20/M25/M40 family metallo-hydrolase [Gemmatimonadales bacterium]